MYRFKVLLTFLRSHEHSKPPILCTKTCPNPKSNNFHTQKPSLSTNNYLLITPVHSKHLPTYFPTFLPTLFINSPPHSTFLSCPATWKSLRTDVQPYRSNADFKGAYLAVQGILMAPDGFCSEHGAGLVDCQTWGFVRWSRRRRLTLGVSLFSGFQLLGSYLFRSGNACSGIWSCGGFLKLVLSRFRIVRKIIQ